MRVSVILSERGSQQDQYSPTITGHARYISRIGLALMLPAIRIGEHDLTGLTTKLWVGFELPQGPVSMGVVPVRHQRLGATKSGAGYLVGVHIVKIDRESHSRLSACMDTFESDVKKE